jgi:hypothetical protein
MFFLQSDAPGQKVHREGPADEARGGEQQQRQVHVTYAPSAGPVGHWFVATPCRAAATA